MHGLTLALNMAIICMTTVAASADNKIINALFRKEKSRICDIIKKNNVIGGMNIVPAVRGTFFSSI
uniref:Uncharacterized protein n=1 Tax=Romanomermis culicivorax TaxID=13658 RepID=A0A915KME7_ROMCU